MRRRRREQPSRSHSRPKEGNPFLERKGESKPRTEEVPKSSTQAQSADYLFPTHPQGDFATAMSAIACNAGDNTKGTFSNLSQGGEPFKDELAQALALKLNLTTTQRTNEKALTDLTKASGRSTGLKQALQARAALYGNLLDPNWLVRNSDLSSKTTTLKKRRIARAMLLGVVLLVAQLGAHEIRSLISSGQDEALKEIPVNPRGTADSCRVLRGIGKSPLGILKLAK